LTLKKFFATKKTAKNELFFALPREMIFFYLTGQADFSDFLDANFTDYYGLLAAE
jgi:hypothetical protein